MTVAVHAGQLLQPVPGGIGSYVRALLRHLPSAGIDPVAFAAGRRPPDIDQALPWVDLGRPRGGLRYECWHRLRRPRLPRFPGGSAGADAEVIHSPSLVVPPARDRPLVVTVHDIGFRRLPESTTPRGRRFHERALALTRRHATLVLTPSHFTRSELVDIGFDPDRVVVTHLGCDPPAPASETDLTARLAAAGVAEPYVLTVGTVEPRKGLTVLARAYENLRVGRPGLSLVLAGPQGWGAVDGLDRPGIRRLGAVSWDLLDALYRRATVCCLPSAYEGFGLPAVEAMARSCPLVVTDATALREVVGDAGVGVPFGDASALARAIADLLDEPSRRQRLRRSGPVRAAAFTWAASARAHAEAYALARRLHHGQA